MSIKILFSLFLTFLTLGSIAQQSGIKGSVIDIKTGESIPGSTITIDNTKFATSSDLDGNYILNLSNGDYDVKISAISYKSIKFKVNVKDEFIIVKSKLETDIKVLDGVNIVENKITHTNNALLMEMRKSEQIVSGVSAQQIAKTQDRNASDVVKRVPGVTIFNNRFVMVRGLSERYNSVLLNGALTPSSEGDKKAFSFDIIPSGILDRLLIYKTGAPELPGEFAGGVIKIFTKTFDKDLIEVNYSTGIRSGTTFNNFYKGSSSSTDILAFDNGTRSLPDNFPTKLSNVNSNDLAKGGQSLNNTWGIEKKQALPDQRLSASFIKNFKIGRIKAGNISSINYSNTLEHFKASNYSYNTYNKESKSSDTIYNYKDENYTNSVRLGILNNWNFLISSKDKIELRTIFNQIGSNQSILRGGSNFEEGFDVNNSAFRYTTRNIYGVQLHGNHELNNELTSVDWNIGYSGASGKEPDFRRIRTVRNINSTDPYTVIISPSASTLDAGRFYSNLNENLKMISSDVEHKISLSKIDTFIKVRTGFYLESKNREFTARWMSYKKSNFSTFDTSITKLPLSSIFSSENINNTTGFKLEEGTNPSDQYQASNSLIAYYIGTSLPMGKMNISGGSRMEYNVQKLLSRDYSNKPVSVLNPLLRILPSINLSYSISSKTLLRLAYSKTLNRPEFRELAPFAYYDFAFNNVIYGNSLLKTPSIDNYDLRYEFYPAIGEMLNIGVFYKKFKDPIEMFFVPGTGSGGTRNFSFSNASYANSIGVELEVRKSLNINDFLNKFSLMLNTSFIKSSVVLGPDAVGQSPNRAMMGQSPYIINCGIFFQDEVSRIQCNILYNVIGKRIFAIGTYGIPDIYEMPRNVIDVTISKGIGKSGEIKISVQDIVNQSYRLIQDADMDERLNSKDQSIMSYQLGQYVSIGYLVKF